MEEEVASPDRGAAISLGLSLAIVVGTFWVFSQAPERPKPAHHLSTAYGVQPENLRPVSDASEWIVEGVVKEVYPATWTTQDKNAPLHLDEMLTDEKIQLRTPVLLDIQQVYKGEGIPGAVLFTLPGGTDGDVTVSSPFGVTPEPGQTLLVFLSSAPKEAGPWSEISPLYPQLFFIVDGEALHGPDTTIDRGNLMAQLGFGVEP